MIIKQGELERALADGKHVLRIATKLYVPPHVDITMAIERSACYHFKLGKRLRDEDGEIGTMMKDIILVDLCSIEVLHIEVIPINCNMFDCINRWNLSVSYNHMIEMYCMSHT